MQLFSPNLHCKQRGKGHQHQHFTHNVMVSLIVAHVRVLAVKCLPDGRKVCDALLLPGYISLGKYDTLEFNLNSTLTIPYLLFFANFKFQTL